MLPGLSCLAQWQFKIDGRQAYYDSETNTMLATVPQGSFGQTLTLNVEYQWPWASCEIDDEPVYLSHQFADIQAEHTYHVRLTDALGKVVERNLAFTFLPIIRLNGTFSNDYSDATIQLSNPANHYTDHLKASIKWRGGTTNKPDRHKRNYKVKLEADTTLMGMRNDDSWILDAGQPDVFRVRNRIAFDLWNDMAPKPHYAALEPKARNSSDGCIVELFLGDEYRGIYNLMEPIDRKQLRLKKVDSKTGEVRGCLYKGVAWQNCQMFDPITTYDNQSDVLLGFEMKYPDLEDNDTTDWAPLVEAVNFARLSTDEEFEEHVEEYFDLESIFYYSIFLSVSNALDNSGKNMYWSVYDKTTDRRLAVTPWDLDCTFGQRWGGTLDKTMTVPNILSDVDVCIFFRLYKSNYKGFNDELNRRYRELRQPDSLLSTNNLLARFTNYYQMLKNSGAAQRETLKWYDDTDLMGDTIDFDKEYTYICNWVKRHMQSIDRHTFPLYYNDSFFNPEGVETPAASAQAPEGVFSLSGQRIDSRRKLKPGIYIVNGRKTIIR